MNNIKCRKTSCWKTWSPSQRSIRKNQKWETRVDIVDCVCIWYWIEKRIFFVLFIVLFYRNHNEFVCKEGVCFCILLLLCWAVLFLLFCCLLFCFDCFCIVDISFNLGMFGDHATNEEIEILVTIERIVTMLIKMNDNRRLEVYSFFFLLLTS